MTWRSVWSINAWFTPRSYFFATPGNTVAYAHSCDTLYFHKPPLCTNLHLLFIVNRITNLRIAKKTVGYYHQRACARLHTFHPLPLLNKTSETNYLLDLVVVPLTFWQLQMWLSNGIHDSLQTSPSRRQTPGAGAAAGCLPQTHSTGNVHSGGVYLLVSGTHRQHVTHRPEDRWAIWKMNGRLLLREKAILIFNCGTQDSIFIPTQPNVLSCTCTYRARTYLC